LLPDLPGRGSPPAADDDIGHTPAHICTDAPAASAPGLGSPLPHLHCEYHEVLAFSAGSRLGNNALVGTLPDSLSRLSFLAVLDAGGSTQQCRSFRHARNMPPFCDYSLRLLSVHM
jgi:hypothetical protein